MQMSMIHVKTLAGKIRRTTCQGRFWEQQQSPGRIIRPG
ncbi:hypothetical protein THTE_1796 [Thermogutta terrifontis]|uniref:Uncharacterized protein n=1 Tax=Thermogutta terrifontis TaxID=1331910 RepID=A0A286REL0_9BACT|nr:hypothetical protein THTE_1796 [Thermogutta terrifontis]